MTPRSTLDWNAIRVGDPIAAMRIDVTATVVVAGAIASRDFMPVQAFIEHFDNGVSLPQFRPRRTP